MKFQIDLIHQFKSLSNGLFHIGIIPVIIALAWFWKGIYPNFTLVIVIIVWTLIWFIPALILHLIYYQLNRKTIVTIALNERKLEILNNGTQVTIWLEEITMVERIYFSDYRLVEWQQNTIPAPWRNYGLLRIQAKDEQEFFLTSLMIDIVNPPIEPTKNTYKFIPLPPKSIKQKRIEEKDRDDLIRAKIEYFKGKFNNQSVLELNRKLYSQKLVDEAKIAAEEIIEEKNTAANKA